MRTETEIRKAIADLHAMAQKSGADHRLAISWLEWTLEPPANPDQHDLWVSSIYGTESQKPYVNITFGGKMIQVPPETAREIASNIMDCASASEIDACLMNFARDQMKNEEAGAHLVSMLREYRGHYKHSGTQKDDEE